MPDARLDPADAAELAELLRFVTDWLASDPEQIGASLTRFVGNPAYDPDQLRDDLHRFLCLLGADDGEALFGVS